MHRRSLARAGLSAAAILLLAGQSPVLAVEPGSGPPAKSPEWGKHKSSLRIYKQAKKESERCSNRGASALKAAARANIEAMAALAQTAYTPEELQALSDAMDASMAEALASSMATLDAAAETFLGQMTDAGATEAQLAKAGEAIDRARAKLQRRADSLNKQLDERFAELFSPLDDDEDDDAGGDDGASDPPPPPPPPQEPPSP